ncbi:hypothetical protein Tco_0714499 [Tanacetum coccineum]
MSSVGKIVHDSNKAPDSPPHPHTISSNQRHCFHCKDVLEEGEFCQQCTSMRCGSGLSKGLCLICASRYGNNLNPNSLNDSPNISENVSQSPPLIDHHCCYGCGDLLDGIPLDSELVSLEVVEIVIPEVRGIDTDILLTIKDDILCEKLLNVNLLIDKIEALKDNPIPSFDCVTKSSSTSLNFFLEETNTFDNSLPESETFCFNLEKKSSGNPTSYLDLSLPDYEAFFHDSEPDSGDFTMDVVEVIFDNPTREPRVHVPNVLPTHPTLHLDLNFILSSDSLFAYVVWIFLSFLTYPITLLYLLSCGNEDTIFDLGISVYHSFMPSDFLDQTLDAIDD